MIPSFTSAFDVVIDAQAADAGYLTNCIKTLGDEGCGNHLVGNCTAPGCFDKHSPFPPYNDGYLTTGYNGNGTNGTDADVGRTFQPYWTQFVEATPAPDLREDVEIAHVKELSPENELAGVLPLPPGSVFPNGTKLYELPQSVSDSISTNRLRSDGQTLASH